MVTVGFKMPIQAKTFSRDHTASLISCIHARSVLLGHNSFDIFGDSEDRHAHVGSFGPFCGL